MPGIEKQAQEPTLAPTIHAVAKPAMRLLAWSSVLAGAAALGAAAARTLRTGN